MYRERTMQGWLDGLARSLLPRGRGAEEVRSDVSYR
jgi:hypothetical protein